MLETAVTVAVRTSPSFRMARSPNATPLISVATLPTPVTDTSAQPFLMRYSTSPASPCRKIVSPALNSTRSSASHSSSRWWSSSSSSILTLEISSIRALSSFACHLRWICVNTFVCSTHRRQSLLAVMVAERGARYSRLSSPNPLVGFSVSVSALSFTSASFVKVHSPSYSTKNSFPSFDPCSIITSPAFTSRVPIASITSTNNGLARFLNSMLDETALKMSSTWSGSLSAAVMSMGSSSLSSSSNP
mmetsp:Transcript_14823/g.26224  ORF Transcript_14823/g.26224 Transcript_14823/m.26224 type:complete len:247 (-) Transcript_14823:602-1342(-)